MLQELRIAGLGVIDDAVLVPDAGFTVVTGETGAGKTMIVTALGLVCGGRSDAAQVRTGAGRAVVEARFAPDPDGPAAAVVADVVAGAGGDADEDGSVVAVRSVGADGRSRAHIGGRSAPVSALADLTDSLVTVHGQAEAFSLLRPGRARSLVDRFGDLGEPLTAYRAARDEWSAARRELADRTERGRERAQREQLLRTALDEITRVAPRPSEDLELVAEVRRLDDADALRTAATEAVAALSGSDTGDEPNAAALLQAAGRTLAASSDPLLSARVDDLRGAAAVVGDVVADLLGYLDRLDADPERLGALLERQAALRGLTRRYGEDVDAVLAWAAEAREELEGLDSSEDAVEKLRRRVAELASLVSATGSALSSRRSAAATRLGDAASAELQHLAMGRARLRVAVERRVATSDAAEAVEVDGIAVCRGAGRDRPGRRAAGGPPGCTRTTRRARRLRRRTLAGDARPRGGAGGRGSGGHPGVRRGGRRCRRSGRHRDRSPTGPAGLVPPGHRGHSPRPGRGLRRRGTTWSTPTATASSEHRRSDRWRAPNARSNWLACWAAPTGPPRAPTLLICLRRRPPGPVPSLSAILRGELRALPRPYPAAENRTGGRI